MQHVDPLAEEYMPETEQSISRYRIAENFLHRTPAAPPGPIVKPECRLSSTIPKNPEEQTSYYRSRIFRLRRFPTE